jgi:4-hydroxy-tetrahydrodipicolinate reductase
LISGSPGSSEARKPGEIGIHALRTGDSPGDHTVIFGLLGETLELTHRALNRDGFARGALDAAKFLAGKPAGRYSMEDVLF